MRARDVMSTPVIAALESWSVREAAATMVQHGFTALPVVDPEGRLVGIVTEDDVLAGPAAGGPGPVSVGAVMTTELLTADAQLDVEVLAHRMHRANVRAVPVVDHGRLAGIVTRRDLLRLRMR